MHSVRSCPMIEHDRKRSLPRARLSARKQSSERMRRQDQRNSNYCGTTSSRVRNRTFAAALLIPCAILRPKGSMEGAHDPGMSLACAACRHRIRCAVAVALLLMLPACVRPSLHSVEPMVSLTVTVSSADAGTARTYSSPRVRIPSRPVLPFVGLPATPSGSFGTRTFVSRPSGARPTMFLLIERPDDEVYVDTLQAQGPVGMSYEVRSLSSRVVIDGVPCSSASGFYVAGVGDTPLVPGVLLVTTDDRDAFGVVNPERHTLPLRPVLHVPASAAEQRIERSVRVKADVSSNSAVIVFAVMQTQEGPMSMGFTSARWPEFTWNLLPGWGDSSFYVLDDSEAVRGECREAAQRP